MFLETLPADVEGNRRCFRFVPQPTCLPATNAELAWLALQGNLKREVHFRGTSLFLSLLKVLYHHIINFLLYPACLITEGRLKAMFLRSPWRVSGISLCVLFKLIPYPKKSIPPP